MKSIEEELQKCLTEMEVLKAKRDNLTKAYKIKQDFANKVTTILDDADAEFYLKNEKLIKTLVKSFDESFGSEENLSDAEDDEEDNVTPEETYEDETTRHVYKEPKKKSKEEQSKTIKDFLS